MRGRHPYPPPGYREERYRTRQVAFTVRDELAFGRVLREFCSKTLMFERDLRRPPFQEFAARIPNIPSSRIAEIDIFMPLPSQEESWIMTDDRLVAYQQRSCRFIFRRGGWSWAPLDRKWVFDPPNLARAEWEVYYVVDDPAAEPFAMKAHRLVGKVTRHGAVGLDAAIWSQTGGVVRRSIGGGHPLSPHPPVKLNKYYDDALWDDRLPEGAALPGAHLLEWHDTVKKEREGQSGES